MKTLNSVFVHLNEETKEARSNGIESAMIEFLEDGNVLRLFYDVTRELRFCKYMNV